MTTKPIGLYVHIPFCLKKCTYCDFCSFDRMNESDFDLYVNALCKEIESYKREPKISVDTIFFGGGTPSILSVSMLEKIVKTIKSTFDTTALSEFTVETNPKTINTQKALKYKAMGVNRVSIGLQSIHQNELKILGRIHNFEDFLEAYYAFCNVGINNINVDLMYGIPEQTKESFFETLYKVIALSPKHLSLYSLILEDNTPLANNINKFSLPDEDTVCDMYYSAAKILSENGYSHYEISNYAKCGFECSHNLKYWNNEEYIGVGISAYSYYESIRFGNEGDRANIQTLKNYLNGEKNLTSFEQNDNSSKMYEYVMLRLRLKSGIDFAEYKKLFNQDFIAGREDKLKFLCENGFADIDNSGFRLTEKGFFVNNSIILELL